MPNLVGIGNSQVPTNAMLGGLAYQDSVGEIKVEKIKARIEDTVTDVFVYDTRKDSDGGAWRHRTQNKSWYLEGPSATRGARREFPAVAVIVAFNSGLIIYDGDDPNLSKWMEWTTTNGRYMLRSHTSPKIAAMNGIIALSNSSTYGGVILIEFISDTARSYRQLGSSNKSEGYWQGQGIATRNDFSANNFSNSHGGNTFAAIDDENTKDVAMAVLENAPLDPDSGLPRPTIAVGTTRYLSFITDDVAGSGSTYDVVGFNPTQSTGFSKNRSFLHTMNGTTTYAAIGIRRLTGDTNLNDWELGNQWQTGTAQSGRYIPPSHTKAHLTPTNELVFGGGYSGLFRIQTDDRVEQYTDLSFLKCKMTTSYNSGWMHGDVRRTFLADTDATDISSGSDLITGNNFNFNSGVGNWTGGANSGSPTVSNNSNRLYVDSNGSSYPRVQLNVGTQSAGTYTISGKYYYSGGAPVIVTGTGGGSYILDADGDDEVAKLQEGINSTRDFSRTFTIASSFDTIGFRMNVAGGTHIMHFDDLRLVKGEYDRSDHDQFGVGLRVFGSITKNPVAIGADLVSYSGWSSANYMRGLYKDSVDDPGSGDYSVKAWIKTATSHIGVFWSIRDTNNHANWLQFWLDNNQIIQFGSSAGRITLTENNPQLTNNQWHCVYGVKDGSGVKIYIDGKLQGNSGSTHGDMSLPSTAEFVVGHHHDANYHFQGELALITYSKSAPTPEQVRKVYNDEKQFFRPHAKCTLYGTSNTVTAIGHDDTNNILHVGTSSGRSEFQGLNRINNTTTAVTTAISASDGLVAEQ